MRILLAANASYVPPRGGATRSNLAWLDQLSARGHDCRVVGAGLAHDEAGKLRQMEDEELGAVISVLASEPGLEVLRRGGVTIYSVAEPARRSQVLRQQIREFQPDWLLVSSEDLGQVLLAEAQQAAPGRVVYLAHTPQLFPFGPASWNPDPHGAALVARAAGIVAIGRHTGSYIEQHLGRRPEVIHPPIYGKGPFPDYASFDHGLLAMINPCALKGIAIFRALAERFPQYPFGAVPGWGTTAADRRALERLPNFTWLPNVKRIEQVLARTRLLLMPSLWYEGFGLSVMEAMLHGVPVIASDSGGLVEAKLGTRFVIPVRPIERYEPVFDEHGLPRAVIPEQDAAPWAEALGALLSDRRLYEEESESSRRRALEFVGSIRPERMEEFLAALAPARPRRPALRILLAHNSTYYPAHGGGDRSNRLLMEALAARGHACRVLARTGGFGEQAHRQLLAELAVRSIAVNFSEGGVVVFRLNGVEVHTVTSHPNLRAYFASQITAFDPDVIVASTDDPAQVLLEAALQAERARVVYLVRATLAVPFGPDCAFPSAEKTAPLRAVDAVVGVSQYVAGYVRQWGGIEAAHLPISLLEPGPYPYLGRFDNEFVTLVNPCAVKGISIFLALAERMPEVRFAAVPTWGTNQEDRAALERRPNVTVLDPVDRIDELLARTRVLLVPSLWAEARSRIIVEAMLRGVPVMAANVGGIPEAKLGVDYLLPVNPIQKYQPRLDEQMVPVAEVPEQPTEAWHDALRRLLSDREHWESLSRASRQAALEYVEGLSVGPFEEFLKQVAAAPRRPREIAAPVTERQDALRRLSPEKRALLALRLRKRVQTADPWFPAASLGASARRLFCFPHAGGGAAAFHGWAAALPPGVSLCPARLPGRESRLAEPPFTGMEALVEALSSAMRPYLEAPFAFFGHSMGAVVAFELARRLRRQGQPLPVCLFVSAARAPQYRLGHVPPPEPSEAELVEQLRRLEGVPTAVLDNPAALRMVLPALRADTALYRNYAYQPEAPLGCPIRAYGGSGDPNVTAKHLQAWEQQTSSSFALRLFPGGHFFIDAERPAFLAALAEDVTGFVPPEAVS